MEDGDEDHGSSRADGVGKGQGSGNEGDDEDGGAGLVGVEGDPAHDDDVLQEDEDGFAVGGEGEGVSDAKSKGHGNSCRFQHVHRRRQTSRGFLAEDPCGLRDFEEHGAGDDRVAHKGA